MVTIFTILLSVFFVCCLCRQSLAASDSEDVPSVTDDQLESLTMWNRATIDGTEFWYREAGKKNAPVIIFIHGFGCHSGIWREQIADFAKDYHVIVPDLPGYGISEKSHDHNYTMDFFARAVKIVADRVGADKPILVGHSMGFSILRRYLINYPNRACALCNVDGFFFRSVTHAAVFNWWKSVLDFIRWPLLTPEAQICLSAVEIVEFSFYGKTPEPLRKEIRDGVVKNDPYVMLSSWESMLSCTEWIAMQSDLPAMVLYSSAVHLFPDAKAWFQTDFPHLNFIEWEDTGHYMMLEKPARFNRQLREFLQKANVAAK